jgi:DNA-binding beta-propeller fold protein YncE
MKRKIFVGVAVVLAVLAALVSQRALGRLLMAQARQVPLFQAEPGFFKIPNNWVTGQGSAVGVDKHDNVWIIHRPRYIPAEKRANAAPPVLEFDSTGKFIKAWGGPSDQYDWPDQEHSVYPDPDDNIWISGSARPALAGPGDRVLRSDNMLLKFDNNGKFIMQIGKRDTSTGDDDTKNVYSATDLYVYPKTGEIFVSDGYINKRVIVFDKNTGAFKRMWGAFGNVPKDSPDMLKLARTPPAPRPARAAAPADGAAPAARGNAAPAPPCCTDPGPQQFVGAVHGIKVANDGMVYVCDRSANRVQSFSNDGKFVKQLLVHGPAGLALSPDPQQQFLYVVDMGGSKIVVVDRKSLEILYQFGSKGSAPGEFQGVHMISIDSKGNLYTAEAEPGNRYQKFAFKGLGPIPAGTQQ